jgi:hypothetical protein
VTSRHYQVVKVEDSQPIGSEFTERWGGGAGVNCSNSRGRIFDGDKKFMEALLSTEAPRNIYLFI